MKRFGSRAKGKVGERQVAKLIQEWWRQLEPEAKFVSTPLSGGWQAPDVRGHMKMAGDLCTTATKFPFCVEVKRRENFAWKNVMEGQKSPVWGWWEQCKAAAELQKGVPLLIFRKNHENWFAMLQDQETPTKLVTRADLVITPVPSSDTVSIFEFERLLELSPAEVVTLF